MKAYASREKEAVTLWRVRLRDILKRDYLPSAGVIQGWAYEIMAFCDNHRASDGEALLHPTSIKRNKRQYHCLFLQKGSVDIGISIILQPHRTLHFEFQYNCINLSLRNPVRIRYLFTPVLLPDSKAAHTFKIRIRFIPLMLLHISAIIFTGSIVTRFIFYVCYSKVIRRLWHK
jgi:hypothetical protein